jgi:murein endopeptidase
VKFLERFAPLAAKVTGWRGILIGDMAQPRGGPLPFGHKSHQIGLDVDIWFMPMPDRVLSKEERENISGSNLVAADGKHIDDKTWSPADVAFIQTAAEQLEVERVLVNAAIKKELCRVESQNDRSWMSKVRPWYGHADHIHVRLKCPIDSPDCRAQPPVPGGDGCDKSLDHWFADWILRLKIPEFGGSSRGLKLKDLPPACIAVLGGRHDHWINSLFRKLHSLFSLRKFAVPICRESCAKCSNSRLIWAIWILQQANLYKFPCIFPCSQGKCGGDWFAVDSVVTQLRPTKTRANS